MINGKKGSHIEVVLSFVIFVTFLIFMYAISKPVIREPVDKEYILNHVKTEIKERTSLSVIYDVIEIDTNKAITSCFILNNYFRNYKVKVKNSNNIFIEDVKYNTGYSGLSVGSTQKGIYTFYYSDKFISVSSTGGTGCTELRENSDYDIVDKKSSKYIFLSEIDELNTDYYENYGNLKTIFGIPDGTDFAFNFTDSDESSLGYGQITISKGVNVYSEEMPIQYIDDATGKIESGFLIIKIW